MWVRGEREQMLAEEVPRPSHFPVAIWIATDAIALRQPV